METTGFSAVLQWDFYNSFKIQRPKKGMKVVIDCWGILFIRSHNTPKSHSGGACPVMLLSGVRHDKVSLDFRGLIPAFIWMPDGRVYDVNGRNLKTQKPAPQGTGFCVYRCFG